MVEDQQLRTPCFSPFFLRHFGMTILLMQKAHQRPMEANKVHAPMPQRPGIPAETHLTQVSLKYLFLHSRHRPAVNHHLTEVKSKACRLPEWWQQQASSGNTTVTDVQLASKVFSPKNSYS